MQNPRNSGTAADLDIERFRAYLATPVEDPQSRSAFGIASDELVKFHRDIRPDIVRNQNRELQILYRSVDIADRADRIFLISDGRSPIAQIRKHLRRIESRTFHLGKTQVAESIYYRYWPLAALIVRELSGPSDLTYELEWVDQGDSLDLDTAYERWRPGFEEESLLLCRDFPQEESVKQFAFLPAEGIHYRIIFSAGRKRKVFEFPIALRYENLLLHYVKRRSRHGSGYTLERVRYEPQDERVETSQRHYSIELAEGQLGLWVATLEYDPELATPIPGYFKDRIRWHMGDEFKKASTEALSECRLQVPSPQMQFNENFWNLNEQEPRILNEDIEHSGGFLDQSIQELDGEDITLLDTIQDPDTPSLEEVMENDKLNTEAQRIIQMLRPIERKILYMKEGLGLPQTEIAKQLGVHQSKISRIGNDLERKIRAILDT